MDPSRLEAAALEAITANFASNVSNLASNPEKTTAQGIQMKLVETHPVMVDKNDRLWHFNGRHWHEIPDIQLGAWAMSFDNQDKPSRTRQNEAVDFVRKCTYQPEIPWRQIAPNEVPCYNGVVNVDTSEVRDHNKNDYLETVIPHAYSPAPPVLWLRVLDDFFHDDPEGPRKIEALQEFFGYILLPHAQYKRALFLWGESNTGKSVITDVIYDLVGMGNVCTISMEELEDPRSREDIVGKMVNLVSELPAEAMIKDAGFKQLISRGDAIGIDPKYKPRFTYVPFCKHVFACNALPDVNDHTRATTNRLLLIHFLRVFKETEQDVGLRKKLQAEMSGILAWAVEGAARLIAAGGEFTTIEESGQLIEEYRAQANPVIDFLKEHTVEAEGGIIEQPIFAKKFNDSGNTRYTANRIGRWLAAAGVEKGFSARNDRTTVRVLLNRRWAGSL